MCGIAGFAGNVVPGTLADARLRGMCGAIAHRGPDDEGRWVDEGIALGMRRLSIIDVTGGRQPIRNEDGRVTVVFNGEIYNHHELRGDLLARGHRFLTHSDTETLVHLYEEHGVDMVRRLRGMFAFALWDANRQRLFVARDRLGIKPLHYWPTTDGVAFASELRSFLALPEFPRALDRSAVAGFLSFGYVPQPATIFSAARKLPPGHWFTWSREEGLVVSRYWSPVREALPPTDPRDLVEELRRLVDDGVRSHLESEVPLGAFLSGGIDSSAVVACMARAHERPVQTFSIGFEEPAFDETAHAASVARDLGTVHTELIVHPDADALTEELAGMFDEPFADASALPTFLVAHLARQDVTVALSGDGGDELFGGYTRYQKVLGARAMEPVALRRALGALARNLPHGAPGRGRLLDLTRTLRGRYAATVARSLDVAAGGVGRPEVAALAPALDEVLGAAFDEASGRDFGTQMTLVDMLTYLPGDILTKVDRTSMAVSLEARVPLLDHPLVEFAAALPTDLKMRDGTGKWIFRQALEGLVPPQVLAKRKQGFSVPLDSWFRGPLRGRIDQLQRPNARINEFVEPSAVARIALEHVSGRRDHKGQLWRLLMLELWLGALASGVLASPNRPSSFSGELIARAR